LKTEELNNDPQEFAIAEWPDPQYQGPGHSYSSEIQEACARNSRGLKPHPFPLRISSRLKPAVNGSRSRGIAVSPFPNASTCEESAASTLPQMKRGPLGRVSIAQNPDNPRESLAAAVTLSG
jgi:hypothetical protein